MWLINTTTLRLEHTLREGVHEYAILSHTWGDGEVSHEEYMKAPAAASQKAGSKKINFICEQARKDNLDYAWVDTCCINKDSSSELSEAINSMYRWYSNARVCYVYMADMREPESTAVDQATKAASTFREQFSNSRWFTRGWTLQELIAPREVQFFDRSGHSLGSLKTLVELVSTITGIDMPLLAHETRPSDYLVATRMSWAAKRETSRPEDRAYSLIGLFDISLPMIYGEGEKAFNRLQEEIFWSSPDLSILAWDDTKSGHAHGALFAPSPANFDIGKIVFDSQRAAEYPRSHILTNKGLDVEVRHPDFSSTINAPLRMKLLLRMAPSVYPVNKYVAVLPFRHADGPYEGSFVALQIDKGPARHERRIGHPRRKVVNGSVKLSKPKMLTILRHPWEPEAPLPFEAKDNS